MWMTDRRGLAAAQSIHKSQKYGITGHGSARTPGTPQTNAFRLGAENAICIEGERGRTVARSRDTEKGGPPAVVL